MSTEDDSVVVSLATDDGQMSTSVDAAPNRVTLLATGPLGALVLEAEGDAVTWHLVSEEE